MAKKRIDVKERDTSAGQSMGDLLANAGLKVSPGSVSESKEESPKPPQKPKQTEPLHIRIEKKGRKGKVVTLVSGFTGLTTVIEDVAKQLKSQCGVGGAVKDREIVLQGDLRKKVVPLLVKLGYKAK